MKMTGDGGPPESSSYDGSGWECGGGKKRGLVERTVREGRALLTWGRDVRWRHEMPWHRLPVCDGRESCYNLRSTTSPTSSVSRMKLPGSMVAIIRSRLARIAAQRGSDDTLNMDFSSPVAKSWWEVRINRDWLLNSARSDRLVVLISVSGCVLVFGGKSIFA